MQPLLFVMGWYQLHVHQIVKDLISYGRDGVICDERFIGISIILGHSP